MKWIVTAFVLAVSLACAALSVHSAAAQEPQLLISPPGGAAGSRFQVVGESGWTPGETVTISAGFSDQPVAAAYGGQFYHERQATVLRDGTWSFPIVVNNELVPFPLYRPGYIVVKAQTATRTAVGVFVYGVAGRQPLGTPPLAAFGSGPGRAPEAFPLTAALFALSTGALLVLAGRLRHRAA